MLLFNSVSLQHLKCVEWVLEAHYLIIHFSLMCLELLLQSMVPLTELAQLSQSHMEPLTQLHQQALYLGHLGRKNKISSQDQVRGNLTVKQEQIVHKFNDINNMYLFFIFTNFGNTNCTCNLTIFHKKSLCPSFINFYYYCIYKNGSPFLLL